MLTLKGRKSLFVLSLLCFSSSVLVNAVGDDGTKYGTESSASSTSSRTSLADLFEKDPRKTLADLIADENGKGKEKGTTLAELIREEGIGEEEFDQFVEEMGENERLIEKVFEDEAKQNENRSNQMNSEMLGGKKGKDFEEKYRIIKAIKEKDTVMSQIIEELRSFKKEIKTGQFSQNAFKGYLQFVIQILALRLRISTEKIVPLKKMSKKRIFIELVKLFIQEKKANRKEAKMRQSVDKKGQNAEKVADKTKANLQRMLQLLGTAVDQIDVGFVNTQKRRTKRGFFDFQFVLILILAILEIIVMVVAIVLGIPLLLAISVAESVLNRLLLFNRPLAFENSENSMQHKPVKINHLPQRIVQEGEQSAESCAICLGNYEQGESVITLPCAKGKVKHEFHTKCIEAWFNQHNTCPLCRKEISKKGRKPNASNAVPTL